MLFQLLSAHLLASIDHLVQIFADITSYLSDSYFHIIFYVIFPVLIEELAHMVVNVIVFVDAFGLGFGSRPWVKEVL